ncbi:MAG: prepilin-type N-terminal cleavage/methylation domain-containing protein [Acidobacteria bacterium]|nr:prepilin-type N-terminal cleavage/methylation domain-containing protein [Acidobacteriota bacterium]
MKNEKGFSLVELLIVLLIIGVIAQLAIPNLLRSRMAGNEGSAINTVRTIISAEMLYVTTRGGGRYGSLDVLSQGSLLDSVVGSATKDGYTFSISLGPADSTYNVNARPTNYDSTGQRSFFGDESAVIRYTTANAPATNGSPVLGQ